MKAIVNYMGNKYIITGGNFQEVLEVATSITSIEPPVTQVKIDNILKYKRVKVEVKHGNIHW